MVGCDLCDTWFHPDCVGKTQHDFNPDKSWRCSRCVDDEATELASQHTHKSVRSAASSKARKELLLKQLEEQRALQLKQRAEEDEIRRKRAEEDDAFLQQKMNIILEDDNESSRSKLSSRVSREKVATWLNGGQSGETVPTKKSPPLGAIPRPQVSQQLGIIASVPDATQGAPELQPKIPTSTSTPNSRIGATPLQATVLQSNAPIQVGAIPSFSNQAGSGYVTNARQKSAFPTFYGGGQSLFGSSQIPQVSSFTGNFGIQPGIASFGNVPNGQMQPVTLSNLQIPVASTLGNPAMAPGQQKSVTLLSSETTGQQAPMLVAPVETSPPDPQGLGVPRPSQLGQQVPIILPQLGPQASAWGNPLTANASGWVPQHTLDASQPILHGVAVSNQIAPTGAQLAARQVMPRELPIFSGDPQDWPLFSSSFYNTTVACGFTDAENLARLQRCLKGHALDSVKSRLLMPQSVPHVMETLRNLYGRPEILIHSLLNGLRNVSPPRTENLQSIISFGMAVRNLVDHMYVAQLVDHLRNPILLHELVEKLPSQMKMQWSWYKRSQMDVNLATFGDFMTELVNTASDVTLLVDTPSQQSRPSKSGRDKQKLYVHAETEDNHAMTISNVEKSKSLTALDIGKKCCSYCTNEKHEIAGCAQFNALDLDGRWKAIRSKGLCRTCLILHRKWPCRSGRECGVDGCRLRHHALLHSRAASAGATVRNRSINKSTGENVTQQNHHSTRNFCLFRYLPVTLERNGKEIETFAFLDDGCQTTLMEIGLAADLGIEGPAESLWLGWTGNITREEKGSQRISVEISGSGLRSQFKLNNVRTVQKLNLQGQSFQYDELQKLYPHLRGLPLRSYVNAVPRIIIGIEHAQLLTSLKVREGRTNEPVAMKTRLGWCVYGKQAGDSAAVEQLHVHTEEQMGNRELHELMKQYFKIEEAVVSTPIESADDTRAREILEYTTRRTTDGFETGLLWKYDQQSFPNSYPLALRRLQSLEKRLDKDPDLRGRVMQLIKEYEVKGYMHQITQEELESSDTNRVWYLPLGVVRNPKKPEKVRLIWDAAARVHGMSLNDMLLKGPDMLTSLFAVLLRFRQRTVAVCGDIREMFYQIRIIAQDKQSQRFLFREHRDASPQIYVMDVATFGATCSPCSSQFIKNKNAREFEQQYPRAVEAIINAHYVDDFLDSVDTVKEAVELVTEVKHVHAQAGFEIRNFLSNSQEVLQQLGETQNIQDKSLNLDVSIYAERVLGMVWKPTVDLFTFDTSLKVDLEMLLAQNSTPTKRQVLRLVMSLFDPYGFIAHFVVHGKILMQHIWRTGTDWDDEITTELHEMWNNWTCLLNRLGEVEVPRCFFGEASSKLPASIQLHLFVDASELAYACVAYLRIVQAGLVRCVLVAAKTKVAPLKPLSIPRLELQAGVIGCRLIEGICAALNLPIEGRYIWTDSTTVLAWIRSDSRRYHPYVAFRVGEILNSTNVDEWYHVPSKQNVADVATKWGNGPDFNPSSIWYTSTAFLYRPMVEWPKQAERQWTTNEELRAVFHHHRELPLSLIDVSRFSNWDRLLRAAAYVQRAVQKFRGQEISTKLTSDDLLRAENFLWRQVQRQSYADEYCTLLYNKQHPEVTPKQLDKCSALYKESPFLDDAGVIRMNSRIGAAPTTPFEAKYPIILPKDHRLTHLLVDSYHRRFMHINNDTVFNEIRQRFRIPQLRPVIKRVVKNCRRCMVKKAIPQPPMMAPLPEVRLTPHIRAFSYTGVDYFGPIMVKQNRSLVKRWVALFTCLTIRAVHLEVVHSLSTQSCVMAIRRFVSRRGAPAAFYSDNGTCFKGSSNLLSEQIQSIHANCAETFTNARTSWHFNPPSAPHMGGSWERMVRSVKAAMAAVAEHHRHPTDEVLETVVLDAEAMVNSRPLTYVPLDNVDQEALTPNHFLLYGAQGVIQPRTVFVTEGTTLRDSWKFTQYLVDQCWRRWVREYLPTLTRRTKWFQPTKPLEPGDIVYVVDENKRNGWLRGRIIEVLAGKDGQVRRAVVQTSDGVLTRPTVKLALLDVRSNQEENVEEGSPELHGQGDVKTAVNKLSVT
ncbi:uncharacterized protein LOC131688239 [Topomyia yanbarensis]|uniref:uncharacterized protein LOC131688239 n=1 Tax=Topomyia yanbarensis TaxID=2498891 RepID=UPI00273B6848|nr:uncharacterized protein LOC131688239 [Topomyia yanbarensis]